MPEEPRATVASWTLLPPNWSRMTTLPEVTGVPLAVTVTVIGCTHPLRVPAGSVVVVDTLASAGTASAITNPAINTSREPRQFMPLTCTCPKDQNRVPPACRSPEPYCIRRGRTRANRRTAFCTEKQKISPCNVGRWAAGMGSARRKFPGCNRKRVQWGHGEREQWYALAILTQGAEAVESAA